MPDPQYDPALDPLDEPRHRPVHLVVHWLVSLGLLGLVAWLLVRNASDFSEVGESLGAVGFWAAAAMVVLTIIIEVTFGWEYSAALPGLRLSRGLVCFTGQTAVSNLIPGPSGTAMRLVMLRSWGFSLDAFTRAWVLTSGITDLLVLGAPIAILIAFFVIVGDGAEGLAWAIAGGGAVIAAVCLTLAILAIRSEPLAARIGAISGRVVAWSRRIARQSPLRADLSRSAIRLRTELIGGWHACGVRVATACVINYLAQGVLWLVCVRAAGLGEGAAGLGGVLVVYGIYRLLTIVAITPGCIGVAEAALSAGMLAVTGGGDGPRIAAAVVLFRGLTYVAPILIGGASLLVWRFTGRWRAPVAARGGD